MLTFAAPANACQLVCAVTYNAYQGDFNGSGGTTADQKCAAEFPGFKFAKSYSYLMNLPGTITIAGGYAWVYNGPGLAGGCSGYTTNANTGVEWGRAVYRVSVGGGTGPLTYGVQDKVCSNPYPLLCCNI